MEKHLIIPAGGALQRICTDLDASVPPANLVLAYGKPAGSVTYLALYMAFMGIAREEPVLFLDGANSFDPYLLTKTARRAGLVPEELLSRVHISRAFTFHQMQALVVERLASGFREFNTNVAIVSGLLDTFYDQDVSFGEAYDLLETTMAELARLAERGARILIACPDTHLPLESRRKRFLNLLKKNSNKILRSETSNKDARFILEKPYRKQYGLLEASALPRHREWR